MAYTEGWEGPRLRRGSAASLTLFSPTIGDTHGFRDVTPHASVPTIYPGAPEPTKFSEHNAGYVAVVCFRRSGRKPLITKHRVGERYGTTRRNLHASDMLVARQRWETADADGTLELLNRHVPQEDEKDRRGFEWYYLWRECHNPRFVGRFDHVNTATLVADVEFLGGRLLTRHGNWISV